jgi:hypothetical protein
MLSGREERVCMNMNLLTSEQMRLGRGRIFDLIKRGTVCALNLALCTMRMAFFGLFQSASRIGLPRNPIESRHT